MHTRQLDYQCQRCGLGFDLEQAIYRAGFHHCPECGSDSLAENVRVPVHYLATDRYRFNLATDEVTR